MPTKHYDVKDLKLAAAGKKRIDWADQSMPVLRKIRERFAQARSRCAASPWRRACMSPPKPPISCAR